MASSFTRKIIEVKISLRDGEFEEGKNTKTLTDLPIRVRVEKTGPPDFCKATVDIRGMKYEDMAKLSTLAFKPQAIARNIIAIYAGNEEDGTSLVFQGEIDAASADFNAAPDVSFSMEAKAGMYGMATAKGPTAVKGNQSCASLVEMQAKEMGYSFENQGVTAQLSNAIFNGSPVQQMRAAASQVGAELLIDDGVVKLIPAGGSGKTGNAVLLNKDSGLFGYPVITSDGLDLAALYNPDFELGGYVKVESIVPGAQGLWRIANLTHDLSAFDPQGGPWESQLSVAQVRQDANKELEDKSQVQANTLGTLTGGTFETLGTKLVAPALSFVFDTAQHEARFDEGYADARLLACDDDPLNETDCTIMCLPDISAAMSEKTNNPLTRQGWIYLHDMFLKWFNDPKNDKADDCIEPYWIDWNWAIKNERVFQKYRELVTKRILNENAKQQLARILLRNNDLATFTDMPASFNYTQVSWDKLQDRYHTGISVPAAPLYVLDGVGIALAGCSIRALADGYSVKKDDGSYEIFVTRLGVFIRDAFNFEAEEGFRSEMLGFWNCKKLDGPVPSISDYTFLANVNFRNFRKYRDKGSDFLVFSQVHIIELPREFRYDYKP